MLLHSRSVRPSEHSDAAIDGLGGGLIERHDPVSWHRRHVAWDTVVAGF